MPRSLTQGAIVWAEIVDPQGGNSKRRPVVVLTPTEEISESETVVCAALSTVIAQPLPPGHILVPWDRRTHPKTGLRKPSVVVCTWLREVFTSAINDIIGILPAKQLVAVLDAVSRLS